MKDKKILLAMDAGFSGTKMCVNGYIVSIPFSVVDMTGKEGTYDQRRIDDGFVRGEACGRNYIIGDVAKEYLANESTEHGNREMDGFGTIARYNMAAFKPALELFIAYALYRYSKYTKEAEGVEEFKLEELGDYELFIGNALPHSDVAKLMPVIDEYLEPKKKKGHHVVLSVGNDTVGITFHVSATLYNSQAICLLVNETTDENGDLIDGDTVYEHLPSLVLDGGYKTFGKFIFGRDQSISGDVSDIEYAMMNVNKKVAERVRVYSPSFHDYMVDEMVESGYKVRYLDEDGKYQQIDIAKLREEVLEEVVGEYIEALNREHNKLLSIESILLGGGTGAAYYPHFKDYCEKNRDYIDVILAFQNKDTAVNGFYGEPVFAIVAGLYKCMVSSF